MENLTIQGLPVHPLIVHAVVIGTPVMTLVGLLMLARAGWRLHWAWPVAVVEVLIGLTSLLAKSTGEGLQETLGGSQIASEHAEYGDSAPYFTLAMAVGAVAFAVLRGRGRVASIVGGVLLVATSVAATVWIVLTGHSGAQSVWGGFGN